MNEKEKLIGRAVKDLNVNIVAINYDEIPKLTWPDDGYQLPPWNWVLSGRLKNHDDHSPALIFWLIAVSQAFRFWRRSNDGSIAKYSFKGKSGTQAIFHGLMDAWGDEDCPVRLREVGFTETTFRMSCGDAPGVPDRCRMLNAMLSGKQLEESADYLLKKAESGVLDVNDARWIANAFPDAYGGDSYLKKAQLVCAAAAGFLSSRGLNVKADLTAMADYQVPRVLRSLGILEYSDDLAGIIHRGELVPVNSQKERAIRGATVVACERIQEIYRVPSAVVDNVLWSAQGLAGADRFHLTETNNY